MKGILLAGGAGSRLHPCTKVVSKQLMPVYDKPMIYYPLSTLMLAGIREVLIISTPSDLPRFRELLGDGARLGMQFSYAEQAVPNGLAQAFVIGREFIAGGPSCLVLGDNIFFGHGMTEVTRRAAEMPGLYFYGPEVCEEAARLRPSARGEFEITDLNRAFLEKGLLQVEILGRGTAWLDTGTHDSLLDASNFVAAIEKRQGLKIACLEEIAWNNGWVGPEQVKTEATVMGKSAYAAYLWDLLRQAGHA